MSDNSSTASSPRGYADDDEPAPLDLQRSFTPPPGPSITMTENEPVDTVHDDTKQTGGEDVFVPVALPGSSDAADADAEPADDHYAAWEPNSQEPFHGLNAEVLSDLTDARLMSLLKNRFGTAQDVARMLYTDPKHGLSEETDQSQLIPLGYTDKDVHNFALRAQIFDVNENPRTKPKSIIRLFFEALMDMMLIILICFAILSLILGLAFPEEPEERVYSWIEGAAILLAVFIVATVTAVSDWSKERKFRQLSKANEDIEIKVIRGGKNTTVLISKLMVGDVVTLEVGDMVPADGLLLEGYDLRIDESSMTGETDLIKKNTHEDPFLLSGCKVQEGFGTMIVTAVGKYSQWGKLMKALVKKKSKGEDSRTPLEQKLDKLAKLLGYIGIAAGIVTTFFLFLGYAILKIVLLAKGIPAGQVFELNDLVVCVRFIVTGVTVVVVAVPEGLPLAVTIALAYSVKKMMIDKNLVRHLQACETMGGATNICSDKTGTLTLNQMRATQGFISGEFYTDRLPRIAETAKAESQAPIVSKESVELLVEGICVNSKANLIPVPEGGFDVQGNKTESALLLLAVVRLGADYEQIRERYSGDEHIAKFYTFSSLKKRMSIIIKLDDGSYRLHTKGASEIVLGFCTHYLTQEGKSVEITDEKRKELEEVIVQMASSGLRTMCIAYKDMPANTDKSIWEDQEAVETNLTVLGIIGIKDPVRKEVPAAIAQCKRSGITVRMVTGDNILTAKHIARECGILYDDGLAIEGPDFRKMSLDEKQAILPKLQVLARSSPQDKYDLVELIKMSKKDVVAVTGDGTNDAPALKKADVGLAMGISGTQVAKEASDIIIMDDNFESIVKSVLWGRTIFENIRKFLVFQMTVNIVALIITVVSAITTYMVFPYINMDSRGIPTITKFHPPLAPVQLLWVNLIMDTLAALALATEPPVRSLLDRPPYRRNDSLITWKMWAVLLLGAIFQVAFLFGIIYGGVPALRWFYEGRDFLNINMNDPKQLEWVECANRTWAFHTFVFMQIFNEFNARKIELELNIFENIHRSPMYIFVIVVTTICQTLLVVLPENPVFQTCQLSWPQWIFAVAFGFLIIPYMFFVKIGLRLIQSAVVHVRKGNQPNKTTNDTMVDSYTTQAIEMGEFEKPGNM